MLVVISSHRFLNYIFASFSPNTHYFYNWIKSIKYEVLPISFRRLETVDLETDPTELSTFFKPMPLSSSTVSGTFTDQ